MSKARKIIIVSLLTVVLLFVILIAVCLSIVIWNRTVGTRDDAARLAEEKYGMEVLHSTYGSARTPLLKDAHFHKYCYYVVGIKDGEEALLIVPLFQREKPQFAEWPFRKSFGETMAALSAEFGLNPLRDENGRYNENLQFFDDWEIQLQFPKTKEVTLDVEFVVSYLYNDPRDDYMHRVCAGQSNGELVFFTDEGTTC